MSAHLRAPGDNHELAEAIRDHLEAYAALLEASCQRKAAAAVRYVAQQARVIGWAPLGPPRITPVEPVSALEALRDGPGAMTLRDLMLATGMSDDAIRAELSAQYATAEERPGGVWVYTSGDRSKP